jgi:hypothetical protein
MRPHGAHSRNDAALGVNRRSRGKAAESKVLAKKTKVAKKAAENAAREKKTSVVWYRGRG